MNKRTILFIHQAFPGQFGSLAASLAAEGHNVFAIGMNPQGALPRVKVIRYQAVRNQNGKAMPPILQDADAKLIRGQSAYEVMKALKKQGVNPDVVLAHPGWGEALFVRNVWPKTRYIAYAEWYYNLEGQEVNFDPSFPPLSEELELRLTVKNNSFLHALSDCNAAFAPTNWQRSRFPYWAQHKIHVIHDGINLAQLADVKPRSIGLPAQGLKLSKGMPIVTFAGRRLEPVRGFHYFMRSLPMILNANKNAHVVIMGEDAGIDNVGYGANNPEKTTWRQSLEKELSTKVDWRRVHFLGIVERKLYLAMLKLSACHVYLTTPFILSWSFLEAAGLGIPIVASDTAPVREFENLSGLSFVNFDDSEGIAQQVLRNLSTPGQDYSAENLAKLQDLDHKVALPKIRKLMFDIDRKPKSFMLRPGAQQQKQGAPIQKQNVRFESIVFLDD